MRRNTVRVGIVGYGVVGSGVAKLLRRKRAAIRKQAGVDIEIRRIAEKDASRVKGSAIPASLFTADMQEILDDPDIRVIVELIGGKTAARQLVTGALARGKHVVTANKALLAARWGEIFSLAERTGAMVRFESSVMAGVPVIRSLHEGLAGNNVTAFMGILNGTTNFILTRMEQRGVEFPKAVEEARKRGLCEADPTLDVDGHDAADKLSILGSLASGQWLPPDSIHTEGIRHLAHDDLAFGREQFGCDVKLLSVYKRRGSGVEARVHPTFVSVDHPLAAVRNEFNAIYLQNDAAGPVMLYGKGAGQMPAASGVIADVIAQARIVAERTTGDLRMPASSSKPLQVVPMEEISSRFYLRFSTVDRPGVLSRIAGALGQHNISIQSVHQRGRPDAHGVVAIVMASHVVREGDLRKAIRKIDAMKSIVRKKTVAIRIED